MPIQRPRENASFQAGDRSTLIVRIVGLTHVPVDPTISIPSLILFLISPARSLRGCNQSSPPMGTAQRTPTPRPPSTSPAERHCMCSSGIKAGLHLRVASQFQPAPHFLFSPTCTVHPAPTPAPPFTSPAVGLHGHSSGVAIFPCSSKFLHLLEILPTSAASGSRPCYERPPTLLPTASAEAATNCGCRCYYRHSPLLPTASAAAATGRRRCYPWSPRLLLPAVASATHRLCRGYERRPPLLPMSFAAATNGRRCCYKGPSPLLQTARPRCYKPSTTMLRTIADALQVVALSGSALLAGCVLLQAALRLLQGDWVLRAWTPSVPITAHGGAPPARDD